MIKRALLAALIATTLGCGKSSPAAPSNPPANPVVRASISGAGTLAPGTSMELAMLAVHFNGMSEDVTAQTTWTSSDPTVLSVTGGRVEAVADGEAIVSAQYSAFRMTKTIDVLEPGTFSVAGSISDGAAGLGSARVDVVSGTGAGRFVTTTSYGGYRIFGLAGPLELRASASGYVSGSKTMNVASNMNGVSFTLTPVVAPADVSGAWQMTIDASPNCSQLADIARHRAYTAMITQNVAGLRFVLGGADFARDPAYGGVENTFFGRITESTVAVTLAQFDYYGLHNDLAELLGSVGVYTAVGTGTGTLNGGTIAVALNGTLSLNGPNSSSCAAGDHRLTLVRASLTGARR